MATQQTGTSARQKMINLMYVVLMAMLALNVSSDVLNGFSLVEDSLLRTTANASASNEALYKDLQEQMEVNPTKVKEWYDKAQYVKQISDSLYNFAEELKIRIVQQTDGKDGDVRNIRNKEDLEAASTVMLAPRRGEGENLYNAINSFRERIVGMVTNDTQKKIISDNLSTDVPNKALALGKNWQEYMFENMPVAAAVTLLSKLQSDVRYAEGEVLHTLTANIDIKDLRVNELNAYVIPSSRTVVQGGKLSAQIIMAAVDTTRRPTIYVGGKKIASQNGTYEMVCGTTGDFTLKGYIETVDGRGDLVRRDFSQPYTVVAPSATVSADLMNVLYAGYENPMSVSIPGVPANKVVASMTGGTLQPRGAGKYIVRPAEVGKDAVITVNANMEGRMQKMGAFTFRVRKLPDPTAYIEYAAEGGSNRFRGGRLSKQVLMSTEGIGAAIDDGLLNIAFRVQGFETVFFDNMGNAVPAVSNSANFTEQQRNMFRSLSRGKRFYISRIRAIGPDGIERTLDGSMEIIIN
ncbi:MAG: gliding motility protein GldM [Paraprevotella sp.]|nr:gliding motility protein GldM [Paraprevotella sp.]MBR2379835.1 gliding motility protein GldM [Paraprevotella sp.]